MDNEIGKRNYRKLEYFFKNKLRIHFKDLKDSFYNGSIIDLNEEKLTLVIQERVNGIIPMLLEDIKPETICEFKEIEDD